MAQIDFQQLLQNVLLWVDSLGAEGAIAFTVLYSVATVLLIPASLITLGGGALFGVALGFLYVFVGAAVGATLAFLLGRYGLRGWVTRQISGNPKFKAIDQAIADGETEGFAKIHLKKGTDKILGATVVAAHAEDWISETTVVIVGKVGLGKIASAIHPYPTQAEAIKKRQMLIGDRS